MTALTEKDSLCPSVLIKINGTCVHSFKDNAPPWRSKALWQAAVTTLHYLISRHEHQLAPARETAGRVLALINEIDDSLDRLCRISCTRCQSPCCRVADVSYDFRDLLMILLTHQGIPPGQPRQKAGDICQYLGENGCRIHRRKRPWICTWYICADQKQTIMAEQHCPEFMQLSDIIKNIGVMRKQVEDQFIRVVAGGK